MTTGLEKRRQKKARRRTRRAGEHGQESRCRQIRTAGKGTGSRRHDGYAGSSRRGQRSSSLRRAENSSRRFSPGPGAGRRGIQPQPPFLKTQRMTKNMTMMPMTRTTVQAYDLPGMMHALRLRVIPAGAPRHARRPALPGREKARVPARPAPARCTCRNWSWAARGPGLHPDGPTSGRA